MSIKVTKVDGSVDENSGLKYTVGDKFLGLLSTSIDKALSNMLKDEEAQLKCSPEYAEGATIILTLVQVAEKHEEKVRRGLVSVQGKSIVDLDVDSTAWRTQNASRLDEFDACLLNEKAISDKTTTDKAESENVVAEGFSAQQVKWWSEKAAEEKMAIAKSTVFNATIKVAAKRKRIQTRRRCSRMYQGTLDRQRLEEERKHAEFLGGVS